MNDISSYIVIMVGGIGSRFRPMRTSEYPKQFIDIMGIGRSLIQMTVDSFAPICPMSNIVAEKDGQLFVCSFAKKQLIKEFLK